MIDPGELEMNRLWHIDLERVDSLAAILVFLVRNSGKEKTGEQAGSVSLI